MNIIPNETLVQVLDYLNYDDLLVAKNVCKRFRAAVLYIIDRSTVWVKEESKYAYMHAKREDDYTQFAKLFYELDGDRSNRCLISRDWKRFRYIADYHQNIKKLILSNPFLMNFLNTFIGLVHLEIFTESWIAKDFYIEMKRLHHENLEHWDNLELLDEASINREYRLNLRREDTNIIYLNLVSLRTFYFITDFTFKKVSIILDCPILNKIVTDNSIDCFKLRNPHSVQEITCEVNSLLITQFKNLKKLTCFYFNHNYSGFLGNLKNLREFYFYKVDDAYLNLSYGHVKIFYKNVQFLSNQTWQNSLKKISHTCLNDSSLEWYSKNFRFLSQTEGLLQRELRANTFKSITPEVIGMLTNLKVFHINYDELDKTRYIEVFKVCTLDRLIVRSPFVVIDQNFLNIIPKYNPMLTYLKVDDFENLKFLLELKYLKMIKTEQFFDIEILKRMFDYLHYLKTVEILITVDIYKFKLIDKKITCSYNHETFLEVSKRNFVKPVYQNCTFKLYQLFITNYK